MKRDPLILGAGCVLSGDEVGKTRPNGNALIVGTTGCGKSVSFFLPTVARANHGNLILSFAKERDGYLYDRFLRAKGYRTHVLNVCRPEQSSISYDPILSLESIEDVEGLAGSIVDATISRTTDDYWQAKARPLIGALIAATIMISDEGSSPGMLDVLKLFDQTVPTESGYSVSTAMDPVFHRLERAQPGCYAVREFNSWHSLPFRTASCVRDTAAAALNAVFPESIRGMMRQNPQLDLEQFTQRKEAIIVITSALEPAQQLYANLFYRDTERQLLRYAARCPNGELPREVRFIFEDFACTARISGFACDISLFRSAGISAVMLLQSEQQLEALYRDEAPIIRQNCSAYVYFPGGFDDRSCEIVSKRMGLPYEEILYAQLGKVFVMLSGRQPLHIPRYDTFHSKEYEEFINATQASPQKGNIPYGGRQNGLVRT